MWVSTPMSHIPAFVRGGYIIPRWPVQQYVGELPDPPVTYDLWWAPEAAATSSHYEDAGDGSEYRGGDYLLHRFRYESGLRGFTLTAEHEGTRPCPHATVTLALHALPLNATPTLTADGKAAEMSFDETQRVYRAEIPALFKTLEVQL